MQKIFKWVAMLLMVVLFFFYGFGTKRASLSNRAIVVGLAIDAEGDELVVSAQILIPQKPGSDSKTNNVVSAKSKTISGAMNILSKETSLVISLSHSSLLIIGKDAFDKGVYNILDYLNRNAFISENVLLVTSLEKAGDILRTKVAFSDMSSYYAQRTISGYGDYLGVPKVSIKEFMFKYYNEGGANALAILEKVETESKDKDDQPEYLFDLSKTAIFKKNKFIFNADKESSEGMSYYFGNLQNGSIFVEGENKESIEVYITKKTEKKKVDLDTLTFTVEINLTLIIEEIISKDNTERPVEVDKLKDSETEKIKEKVKKSVTKAFVECQKEGVDIYDAYGIFYGKYSNKFKNKYTFDDFMKEVKLETKVNIKYK